MTSRNTNTGGVLEAMVYPVLARGGYGDTTQVHVGQRCGGRPHKVDAIATKGDDDKIPISLKWQQTGGTAEQKVPSGSTVAESHADHSHTGSGRRAGLP